MDNYTFDLQRIFFGDLTFVFLFEIVFRTFILFVFLIAGLRLTSQRGVSQLSPFEIALIIGLGSASGDGMFYPDVPLVHCMVVIAIVLLVHRGIIMVNNRYPKLEKVIEGQPHRVVRNGILDIETIHDTQLSRDEVLMELRQEHIVQLGEVQRAYLEIDGLISVIKYPKAKTRPGLCILPNDDAIDDLVVILPDVWVCEYCGRHRTSPQHTPCENCGREPSVTAVQLKDIL